jgi:hypothetical protein
MKSKRRLFYDVQLHAPAPNKMFSPWQTAITKFLIYTQPVKCAYCGRMSRHHWTQLKFFRVMEGFEKKMPGGKVVAAESFTLKPGKEIFAPLAPVCRKHILQPQRLLSKMLVK